MTLSVFVFFFSVGQYRRYHKLIYNKLIYWHSTVVRLAYDFFSTLFGVIDVEP